MRFLVHAVIGVTILHLYPSLRHLSVSTEIVYGNELSRMTKNNMNTYTDFGAYLRNICKQYGNEIFRINAETGEFVTRLDVLDKSHRIAKFLLNSGCSAGSVVGVYCENSLEYPSILLAVFNIGATYTSVDIRLSTDDIIHNFNLSKPSIVFTSSKFSDKIEKVRQRVGSIKLIVNVDTAVYPQQGGREDFQYVVKNQTDTAMISYTSGTTGLPRGVMQSHKSWIFQMELYRTEKVIPFPRNNVSAALLPPGRTFELFAILTSFVSGHKYIMIEEYDKALYYIEKYRINTFYTNPYSARYLAAPVPHNVRLIDSVKFVLVGGDFLQSESEAILKSRYQCGLLYLYGQTETAGFSLLSFSSATHGRLMPGMKGKIVDIDTGALLGPQQRGEFCVQGPLVFNGYVGSASGQGLDTEGWLHSGDYGYYDSEANFSILDRLKTLMKCEGGHVSPIELEMFLLRHPDVEDVAVVPVPARSNGFEFPRAYVVKKSGSSVSEGDIMRYVEDNLSSQKALKGGVRFVDSLPKKNDKIARNEVRKWVGEERL